MTRTAALTTVPIWNSILMEAKSSRQLDVTCFKPSTEATASSIRFHNATSTLSDTHRVSLHTPISLFQQNGYMALRAEDGIFAVTRNVGPDFERPQCGVNARQLVRDGKVAYSPVQNLY